MLKSSLLLVACLSLLGCGGTASGGTTTDLQRECPAGGHVRSDDDPNCAVVFEGCCFADEATACAAAGCETCDVMDTQPAQVARCESACPAGGVAPVAGPDGVPENCAVLFEGCCFAEAQNACEAAGCGSTCEIAESYPGQLARCEPSCPAGGVTPVAGPDGVPENCAVLFEGCCYADSVDACQAADCAADECRIATSYPGQLGRCE